MPKVLMYYSYGNKIGGPLTYINTIINSSLRDKYTFVTCFQNKAPGGWDAQLLRDMTENIKKEKPDIVHVHGAQSEGFYGVLAAKKAGCKHIVMTVHGFAFDAKNCKGIKHFLYRHIIEPYSLHKSDKVYCVCEFASKRRIIQKNCKKNNCGYIHNTVPELVIKEDRCSVRERCGIDNNDVVFAISGRLTEEKGFPVLEKAIKLLNEKTTIPYKLLVIGDGPYRKIFTENMRKEIDAGQIIFTGHTNRVPDYLAASDVFVFPSYHENLSIALLEACASSLPCIVSNVGGNSEIVSNGENGFVIDGFQPENYAEKMLFYLENKNIIKEMGDRAYNLSKTKFSLTTMCNKIDEVYTYGLNKKV